MTLNILLYSEEKKMQLNYLGETEVKQIVCENNIVNNFIKNSISIAVKLCVHFYFVLTLFL